jgi:hypothetical protein
MDVGSLMLSMLFGLIGTGFLMFGKKAGHVPAMGAGLMLMVLPAFMPSVLMMLLVCGALTAVPFVLRAE